jgi:predicted Zn-dependent protease
MNPLNYLFLKMQAVTLLVFGQREAALQRFNAMLALAPRNRYVMASRAHLLGQLGDKHGAVAALRELASAHPDQLGCLVQPRLHAG